MKKIALTLLALSVFYPSFFSEKARLDREVNRLCTIDGGIRVYEKVKLPIEKFDQHGQIYIPARWLAKPKDEYYYEGSTNYLVKGNPELLRLETRMYRKSDNTLLGESILYVRRGGNLPGPWHPSSFSCPQTKDLSGYIFLPQSEGR